MFTVGAVALIMGLFGQALLDFAEQREKTGTRSAIVLAMIHALPDRDGDVHFTTASPSPAVASAEIQALADVEAAQRQWAALWSKRDAQAFLKLYDPVFPDFERYAQTRTHRMQTAREISVDIKDLSLVATDPGVIVARFTQHYRSDAYQDSVNKELVWKRGAQGYRIVSEKTVK